MPSNAAGLRCVRLRWKMPLRWKLLLWIGLPVVLIYLTVLWLEYRHLRASAFEQVGARYSEALARRAGEADAELRLLQASVAATASVLAREGGDEESLRAAAADLLINKPLLSAVEVTREGDKLARVRLVRDGQGSRVSTMYRLPEIGPDGWTTAKTDDAWRHPLLTVRSPAPSSNAGRVLVRAEIAAKTFGAALATPLVETSLPVVLDADGKYVWHFEPEVMSADITIFERAVQVNRPEITAVARDALTGNAGMQRMAVGFVTDEPYLLYHTPMRATGWTMISVVPEQELMAPVYAHVRRTAIIMLAGLAFILSAIWLMSRRVTRPLAELARQSELLRPGDAYAAPSADAPKEVARLTLSLDAISRNVREAKDRIADEVARREVAETELRVARRMQESLLPTPMSQAALRPFGVSLHAVNVPAVEVAGDFFDHFVDARGRLVVCIADVSGKGASAAMLMAVARTALRCAADEAEGAGEIVRAINRVLLDTTHDTVSFVTMLVLLCECDGRMRYANAGHPPGVCVQRDGSVVDVAMGTGTVVGIVPDEDVLAREAELPLPADWSRLVFVTDGVLEAAQGGVDRRHAAKQQRDMFGVVRLRDALIEQPQATASEMCRAVVSAVERFEGAVRSDDVTVLVVAREGASGAGAE
jgi:phosphoserine phosphatase RsbU/P